MSQEGIIDVVGSNPQIPTDFVANVGNAVPIANTLEILGSVVLAGTNPLRTVGSGNTIDIQAQITQAIAGTNATNIGLSAFNSADFSVDANGFVSLLGPAASSQFNVDASTPPGTDPVVPDGSGIITVTGGQVAAGTTANVIQTNSLAANTYTIQIQRSSTEAATTIGANGVSHFNSSHFSVDANGFVSTSGTGVANTITGDSGGALSPTAGNWNILGLSGSKTSGTASTLTIHSPPFSQIGASATSVLNTGEFVTAAVTRTLPVSAGLIDGDLFIYVCTTSGALAVQSVGAQRIRIGSLISSVAGAATSTAIGDSLTLRFNAVDGFFYAVSSMGTWILT